MRAYDYARYSWCFTAPSRLHFGHMNALRVTYHWVLSGLAETLATFWIAWHASLSFDGHVMWCQYVHLQTARVGDLDKFDDSNQEWRAAQHRLLTTAIIGGWFVWRWHFLLLELKTYVQNHTNCHVPGQFSNLYCLKWEIWWYWFLLL